MRLAPLPNEVPSYVSIATSSVDLTNITWGLTYGRRRALAPYFSASLYLFLHEAVYPPWVYPLNIPPPFSFSKDSRLPSGASGLAGGCLTVNPPHSSAVH